VRRVLVVIIALVLAAPAAAAPKLHVVVTGQDHQPRVGRRWHYEVRVTNAAGKPVAARIHLEFLFAGVPVGQVGVHFVRNGFWQETFGVPGNPSFPPASRGQHLVLEASATAKGYAPGKAGWPLVPR
jgi:hypothetical protein